MSAHREISNQYAELAAVSNFSFLHGASHPEELVVRAKALGLSALALTDINSFAGSVRAHVAAREAQFRAICGVRLRFVDGTPDILAYPKTRQSYGQLCRLLTLGNRRAEKGACDLVFEDLLERGNGAFLALVGRGFKGDVRPYIDPLKELYGDNIKLAISHCYRGDEKRTLGYFQELSRASGISLLAIGDVLYHDQDRNQLQDVLTAIRLRSTLEASGAHLEQNAERMLRSQNEMARLFKDIPQALSETVRIIDSIEFSLDDLRYEYPDEPSGQSANPQEELERLTWQGAHWRYPDGVKQKVKDSLTHELSLINRLDYASYFLTVYDVVRFARSRNILCQGRGSAANSSVCYCLGITEVDPGKSDLLFERFISEERKEPPDIDVDFEHERREEVIQYIYKKYGRERAGLAATVVTYRARSASREVGKAFGLSEDAVGAISSNIWGWSTQSVSAAEAARAGLDPQEPMVAQVLRIAGEIAGFPRHLSQHVGGFVITRGRLDEVVPVHNAAMEERTVIEWDKDDLDALGILKIDVLALGMLSCIRGAFSLLAQHYQRNLTLSSVPAEESDVYDMICRADTLGVFQIESRAQMTMLPRLRPRTFYDLVIEVAIVRPGPIQGDMVHPYLRRRQGLEPVSYPSKELEDVLGKTLGVPLFQEQAMKIAIVAAGFTPGEADKLRRAMATFRRVGTIGTFQHKMIEGMVKNGYEAAFAERCFRQIEGFGEYGFPESHAASFALLVYVSCWLKCYYPDVYCAALLNAQPMGFYAPAQIVRDAIEHGVEVRPPDINFSNWDSTLEEPEKTSEPKIHRRHKEMEHVIQTRFAVRLGFREIKGLNQGDMETLIATRHKGFDSVRDLWLRTGFPRHVIERLADADAFRSLGLERRDALWAARALGNEKPDSLPLFDETMSGFFDHEPDVNLPPMSLGEHVVNDYRFLSLSLKAHPVSFIRAELKALNVIENERLAQLKANRFVGVAGLVLVRQRPGSAKGVIFATLEDETGVANIIVWPKVFEKYRPIILGARLLRVEGQLQSQSGVIHVVARHIYDATGMIADLSDKANEMEALARADEVKRPQDDIRTKIKPRSRLARLLKDAPELQADIQKIQRQTTAILPKGRNFH